MAVTASAGARSHRRRRGARVDIPWIYQCRRPRTDLRRSARQYDANARRRWALLPSATRMERAMPQAIPSHESDRPPPGVIDPPPSRPTVGDATRRYWPLVLIAVLVLGAFGAYTGHSRRPA